MLVLKYRPGNNVCASCSYVKKEDSVRQNNDNQYDVKEFVCIKLIRQFPSCYDNSVVPCDVDEN